MSDENHRPQTTSSHRQMLCAGIMQSPNTERSFFDVPDSLYNESQPRKVDENGRLNSVINSGEQSCIESKVTPLMLVCDKALNAPLVHLKNKIEISQKQAKNSGQGNITLDQIIRLWGHPTEMSSVEEGGNSAAHHALAAGFSFGIDVLEYFKSCCNGQSNIHHDKLSSIQIFLSILSQANANGDTPIMMACVFGCTSILKHSLQRHLELSLVELENSLSIEKLNDSDLNKLWRPIQDIFATRNHEGCSALNLSSGHGNVETLELIVKPLHVEVHKNDTSFEVKIINDNDARFTTAKSLKTCGHNFKLKPLVEVSHEDIKFCKSTRDDLDVKLKFMKQRNKVDESHLDEFERQRRRIRQCEDILILVREQLSFDAMKDLMSDEKSSTSPPKLKMGKKKARKKKSQQKRTTDTRTAMNNDNGSSPNSSHGRDKNQLNEWKCKDLSGSASTNQLNTGISPFITLQDGRVISKSQQPDALEVVHLDEDLDVDDTADTAPSLEKVLQSHVITNNQSQTLFNIEAQMESLCLEKSMLLLSAHGMAMQLSPCQLETMQKILLHQLEATKKAQSIQKRLLSDGNKDKRMS